MEERELVAALRAGDEGAFRSLIVRLHPSLVRVAQAYVPSRAIAEEVAQETWLAVLEGLDRFEERSSLKTWIFRILTNRAKTRGVREARSIPFAALEAGEPAVEPERFKRADEAWPGHWAAPPLAVPEEALLSAETERVVADAIAALPERQRLVVTLRDIDGWTGEEVCNALSLSETNQRVLLHRGRASVRRALERYLEETQT